MSNHEDSQSAIIHKLKWFGGSNLTLLPEVFQPESDMFSEIQPNRGTEKHAIIFTNQLENKLLKVYVL